MVLGGSWSWCWTCWFNDVDGRWWWFWEMRKKKVRDERGGMVLQFVISLLLKVVHCFCLFFFFLAKSKGGFPWSL